jgi:putative endonuclease
MALPTMNSQAPTSRSGFWLGVQARIIRRLHALHRTRTAAHLETGALGEREALFYLRRHGYTVVARRWKTAVLRGDIDLIAWHSGTLCFVEGKTRSHHDSFAAEFAVDDDKQRFLRRLARAYIHRIPKAVRPATARFDVLSLYLAPVTDTKQPGEPEFVLNQGAFGWA